MPRPKSSTSTRKSESTKYARSYNRAPVYYSRPSSSLSGHGSYKAGLLKGLQAAYNKRGSHMFERLGTQAGGLLGNQVAGQLVGKAVDKMTGKGEYFTNSLISDDSSMGESQVIGRPSRQVDVPQFSSSRDEAGSLTITHREYLLDLYGTGVAFQNASFPLNPGMDGTFPFLSQLAQNYDEYEFKQLCFTFRSVVTELGSSSTGQVGTVVMATQYNASSTPFLEKQSMMEYDGSMSCKTTDSMLHGVECDPKKLSGPKGRYIRSNPVPGYQDVKSYDSGIFNLALCNLPSGYTNTQVGELWVSYTVTLRKPKLFTGRALNINQDLFINSSNLNSTLTWSNVPLNCLHALENNIGTSFTSSTSNFIFTFPPTFSGAVEIRVFAQCASTFGGGWLGTFATTGNCSQLTDMYGCSATIDNAKAYTYFTNGAFTSMIVHYMIQPVTGSTANTVTINHNLTTSPSTIQVSIFQLNPVYWYDNSSNFGTPIWQNSVGTIIIPN